MMKLARITLTNKMDEMSDFHSNSLCFQSPESHDRLFVSGGGVVSADELRWTGSPRPLPPGSPPRWPPPHPPGNTAPEKRLSPAHHQLDYDDSLDGAPSSKRPRHSVHHTSYNSYNSRVPGTADQEGEEEEEGYNSEDEYSHVGQNLSEDEWREKDSRVERMMRRKGYIIKKMGEDGACLFRAVADQLYGDEEMHQGVRSQCMDYIVSVDHSTEIMMISMYCCRRGTLTTSHSM